MTLHYWPITFARALRRTLRRSLIDTPTGFIRSAAGTLATGLRMMSPKPSSPLLREKPRTLVRPRPSPGGSLKPRAMRRLQHARLNIAAET